MCVCVCSVVAVMHHTHTDRPIWSQNSGLVRNCASGSKGVSLDRAGSGLKMFADTLSPTPPAQKVHPDKETQEQENIKCENFEQASCAPTGSALQSPDFERAMSARVEIARASGGLTMATTSGMICSTNGCFALLT